jgi:flagellar basal body rod protein FlgG
VDYCVTGLEVFLVIHPPFQPEQVVVVYATTNSYTGIYQASSGANGVAAEAETVYLRGASTPDGHLMVDNNGVVSALSSTPIRSVGRHTITAVEEASALYRIVSNTEDTITLETADDLAAVVGQELVGVHTFDNITVTGGASLTFKQDNVLLTPDGTYVLSTGGTITTDVGSD